MRRHHNRVYLEQLASIQKCFNLTMASITFKDVITEARSVPVFTGGDTYSLSSFIQEVETLTAMMEDENAKKYIYRILFSKIQGQAASSVRKLQSTSWDQVKIQLVKSFGIQEKYLQLKEEADQIAIRNVSQIFSKLSDILDKLNMKYSLDEEKPTEFNPINNEKSILEKFLNKISRIDAMYVRTKNIQTLEEAYQALVETGITQINKPDFKNNIRPNNQSFNFQNNIRPSNQNFNYRNNNNNRANNQNNFNRNNNYRNNNQNNFRYNNNSGSFRRNSRNNYENNYNNNNQNNPESMEIDHNVVESSANFHLPPRTPNYL